VFDSFLSLQTKKPAPAGEIPDVPCGDKEHVIRMKQVRFMLKQSGLLAQQSTLDNLTMHDWAGLGAAKAKQQPRTVEVVDVRVEAARVLHRRVEPPLAQRLEARPPELQAARHDPHVALAQRVLDHVLILFRLHGASLTGSGERPSFLIQCSTRINPTLRHQHDAQGTTGLRKKSACKSRRTRTEQVE
jgi:hypothetical protein